MRWSLTRGQRGLLLFCSASGYMAWLAGLGDRSDAQEMLAQPAPMITIRADRTQQPVSSVIRRDPFAGGPATGEDAPVRNAGRPAMTANAMARGGPGVEVPNLEGKMPIATDPPSGAGDPVLILRATIAGPNPVAYVENGVAMDIVRVGDTFGDRRIARIDLRGITFADGTRLDLPATYGATPIPQHVATGIPITLEVLRTLLPARHVVAPATPATTAPITRSPAAAAYPSPAPLATADTRGLPVGVNPTPDANAATAYPYPYPYAPPVRR